MARRITLQITSSGEWSQPARDASHSNMARASTQPTALSFLPQERDIDSLKRAAHDCRGCDLYRSATQTVFGEGPAHAVILFVGEQPGDQEDKAGLPFVGPAGKLFGACMKEAGLDRSAAYVTNAVKHFK